MKQGDIMGLQPNWPIIHRFIGIGGSPPHELTDVHTHTTRHNRACTKAKNWFVSGLRSDWLGLPAIGLPPWSKYPGYTGTHRCYGINDVAVIGSGIDCHTYMSEVNTLSLSIGGTLQLPILQEPPAHLACSLESPGKSGGCFRFGFSRALALGFCRCLGHCTFGHCRSSTFHILEILQQLHVLGDVRDVGPFLQKTH